MNIPVNIAEAIQRAATDTNTDYNVLVGFAAIESGFKTGVTSPTGVNGLFQITRKTWKGYSDEPYSLDPYDQAIVAANIIKDLQSKYNNLGLVAIAYNAGEGVASKLRGKELNYENIEKAVLDLSSYWEKYNIDPNQKVREVFNYPTRLQKALGSKYNITNEVSLPSSQKTHTGPLSRLDTPEINTPPIIPFEYNKEKSFFQNACNYSGFVTATSKMEEVFVKNSDPKLLHDRIKKSKLKSILRA